MLIHPLTRHVYAMDSTIGRQHTFIGVLNVNLSVWKFNLMHIHRTGLAYPSRFGLAPVKVCLSLVLRFRVSSFRQSLMWLCDSVKFVTCNCPCPVVHHRSSISFINGQHRSLFLSPPVCSSLALSLSESVSVRVCRLVFRWRCWTVPYTTRGTCHCWRISSRRPN